MEILPYPSGRPQCARADRIFEPSPIASMKKERTCSKCRATSSSVALARSGEQLEIGGIDFQPARPFASRPTDTCPTATRS